ncbi:TetR/AcrR family transcriptional regulator [Nodosilinea sp. P-1105]|uniref:TetR/AcrR family transcriptional regulator n=1 Tax=Nodosilinea sp. P-1105 TaxID=2546229 RepID=UPI00324235F6
MPHSSPVINDKAAQILQGAMQEFLQHGYAGTSMDRVAATAGVSKPTVYSYFQDKEGLFQALVKYVAQTRCQQVMGQHNWQGEPAEVIRRLATNAIETELQDMDYQNFLRLMAGESGRFPQLAQAFVENLTKPAIEQLTAYLNAHSELGLPDPEAAARVLLGSTVFFIMTQSIMHGQAIMPMAPERLVDSLVYLLTRSHPQQGDQATER